MVSDYDPFAEHYDVWSEGVGDDVPWYVSLARDATEPVLELAVGTGRVAIPIAQETGMRVIGIDSSPAMLAIAGQRARGLPVELRQGDMRELTFESQFDLVICPARSLLHLANWRDRRRVFEGVAAALKPGGRFAWNAFVFSPLVAAHLQGMRQERLGGLWEESRYVPADSRIELTRGVGERVLGTVRLYWTTKSEWEGLIDVAGLEVEGLYGGFDHQPFADDSLEFVWVVRKP